jgi:hypothetical protein
MIDQDGSIGQGCTVRLLARFTFSDLKPELDGQHREVLK